LNQSPMVSSDALQQAVALHRAGDVDGAIALAPGHADARDLLGMALTRIGRAQEAVASFDPPSRAGKIRRSPRQSRQPAIARIAAEVAARAAN